MSDLQRQFQKAKLAQLPSEPPMPRNAPPELSALLEDPDDYEDDGPSLADIPPSPVGDDSSSASSASSTSTIRPNLFLRPDPALKKTSLDPLPWNIYFSTSLNLHSPSTSSTHHVYLTPPTNTGPLFVMHHGAGSSGLSFALLASEIRKLLPAAGVLSLDARGHGETVTPDDNDLRLSTLSSDFVNVLNLVKEQYGWAKMPALILVGHSLGGAIVAEVAKSGALGTSVLGYAVLDVVEGSAMDALQSMQTYLSTRPAGFSSVSQGIEWHTRSRTIRNRTSARISVPALLHNSPSPDAMKPWRWRTVLSATQPFWENWFVGLSKKFLEARGGKLLILAGTDRLDKELMIGQMQGKYQLLVLPEVGHFLHEDAPEKTAAALVEFYKRNDRSALVLPPKVSDTYK
ncbi:Protein phosphatase methylesterase 1 [Rhizina undulata]